LGSITYVGNHGAEILRGGQTTADVDPEVAEWARRVRQFAEGELRGEELHRRRVRGEDKDVIFGFHRRGAPDEEAAEEAVRAVADGRLREAVCLGVASEETPPELEEAADLLVDGPLGVRGALEVLAAAR